MFNFTRISIVEARTLINNKSSVIIDVRDDRSYSQSRIKNALQISPINLNIFVDESDKNTPLVVYCYHGNSSQSAAHFFSSKGFQQTYSVDGGFEDWSQQYPLDVENS